MLTSPLSAGRRSNIRRSPANGAGLRAGSAPTFERSPDANVPCAHSEGLSAGCRCIAARTAHLVVRLDHGSSSSTISFSRESKTACAGATHSRHTGTMADHARTNAFSIAATLVCLLGAVVAPVSAQAVNVWLTTGDRTMLLQPQNPVAFAAGSSATLPTVAIPPAQAYQTVEGFGASMTDSAAYLLHQKVPPAALPDVLQSLFGRTNGIGVSFLRNPMGASDLARSDYSYDDVVPGGTDPNLASFYVAHDEADILPLLRQAKAINPSVKMLGSPWSAPGWMKSTGSMIGGSLLASSYTRSEETTSELQSPCN